MECEFCHTILTNRRSLKRHQLSKSCQKIQKSNIIHDTTLSLECYKCKKKFTRVDAQKRHISNCNIIEPDRIIKLQEQLREKDLEIETLRLEVKQLIDTNCKLVSKLSRSSDSNSVQNNNNNITTNIVIINCAQNYLVPLTEEMMSQSSEHMTLKHLQGGGAAMARLALSTTLNGDWKMVVTDLSRKKSMFKASDDAVVEDLKVREFMRLWCLANLHQAEKIYMNEKIRLESDEIPGLDEDDIKDNLWYDYGGRTLHYMKKISAGETYDNEFTKPFCKTVIQTKAIPSLRTLLNRAFQEIPIEISD